MRRHNVGALLGKALLLAWSWNVAAGIALGGAIGQSTTSPGAAFVSTCTGDQIFSGLNDPGAAINSLNSDQYVNCSGGSSAVGSGTSSSSSNSGSNYGNTYSNTAFSMATPGAMHLIISNTGNSGSPFPGAAANAGWNDTITWAGPTGYWVTPLHIHGTLDTTHNAGGTGTVQVGVYRNYGVIQPYGSQVYSDAFNAFTSLNTTHNGTIYSGWDYQMIAFGVTGDGTAADEHLSVDEMVYFAIPVTFGQQLEIGFYINALAGEHSSGGAGTYNTTDIDFLHSVYWGGKGYVVQSSDGTATTNFTIGTSASGFDYNNAATPEGSTALLLGSGLLLLGGLRKFRSTK